MKKRLYVVGLGPAGIEAMTLGDYRLIKAADKVFLRTLNHPCAQDLLKEGLVADSFDELYDRETSFERVYEGIVKGLEEALEGLPEVVYGVPGHPAVAEKSVQLLLERLSQRFEVIIRPALSFLDPLFGAIPFDPIAGFALCNFDRIKDSGINGRDWLVIPQVYNTFIASEVKLDLMEIYPEEAKVYKVQALGTPEQQVVACFLYELDHQEFDHLSTVVVPPHGDCISINKLLEVMDKLRSPDGCPWDREQTHDSLKPSLVEEAYEVLEAIERGDMYNLSEELGDLLLQIVFHAQLAREAGEFHFQDVLRGIIEKLIRRHPHVFGEEQVSDSAEVLRNWEQIKVQEKGQAPGQSADSLRFDFPRGLPALMIASKTQKRVGKAGFDWPDIEGPLAKVHEELAELQEAIRQGQGIKEEFGDLLFAAVNVARFLQLDPEEALRSTVRKFQSRYRKMWELASDDGHKPEVLALEQLDVYWERAKKEEKKQKD